MSQYRSVLVGIDFSACSAAALRHARRIASSSGAKLQALHVVDTNVVVQMERDVSPVQASIRAGLMADASRAWASFESANDIGGEAEFQVEINNRVVGLLQHAAAAKADLLVLGAFGEKRPDVGIGTVATGCVREATCDVLVVRDTQKDSFKQVLACVDFSEDSRLALRRAAERAAAEGAALNVLHVYNGPTAVFPFLTSIVGQWVEAVTDFETRARKQLEDFCSFIPPPKPALHVAESASHGREIARFAKAHAIDLIVLGRRGHSTLHDLVIGSTAERALCDSPSSVLIVAGPVR